jgi:hypothetical protein
MTDMPQLRVAGVILPLIMAHGPYVFVLLGCRRCTLKVIMVMS